MIRTFRMSHFGKPVAAATPYSPGPSWTNQITPGRAASCCGPRLNDSQHSALRCSCTAGLHGLRVKDAIAVMQKVLALGHQLVVLVGGAAHSKLRLAIEQMVQRHNMRATPGVPNEGCITIKRVGAGLAGGSRLRHLLSANRLLFQVP
ncbi:hypothetical protein Vretifemale_4213 [Volvox reticuliferus]|nr:hypothetical protein Vretifemale_4213 [Volvox reticuliferus]